MIRVSISYGFGSENRYNLEDIPKNIQLALYKYDTYSEANLDLLEKNNINVNVVHLPIDTLKRDPEEMVKFMNTIHEKTGTEKFVIHPNKSIKSFIYYWIACRNFRTYWPYKLCIENFQWRKKKEMRSPLEIMAYAIQYPHFIRMCLDTSHTEEIWLDHKILYTMLPYISVIHLSNRSKKDRTQHMPFNSGKGDLNLMAFVNNLKFNNWNGDIVLEYMEEHRHKLFKNYYFLEETLNGKNRKSL